MENQLNSLYNEAQNEKDALMKQIQNLNKINEKSQQEQLQSKNTIAAIQALEQKYNDLKIERDQAMTDVDRFSMKIYELTEQLESSSNTQANNAKSSTDNQESVLLIQSLQNDKTNLECQLNEIQLRLKKTKDENLMMQSELSRMEQLLSQKEEDYITLTSGTYFIYICMFYMFIK